MQSLSQLLAHPRTAFILYFCLVFAALILPRASVFLLIGLGAAFLVGSLLRRIQAAPTFAHGGDEKITNQTVVMVAGLCFAAIAALSSIWSLEPLTSLAKSAVLALVIAITWFSLSRVVDTDNQTLRYACYGILAAATAAYAVHVFELFSSQQLRKSLSVHVPELWPAGKSSIPYLNRVTHVATLLLIPSWVVAGSLRNDTIKKFLRACVFAVAMAIILRATSQTAQLALLGGAAAWTLAFFGPMLTRYALKAGWIVLVVGSVPLALFAHDKLRLHEADWLMKSAQVRVVIWAYVAEEILVNPLTGVGARMRPKMVKPRSHAADYDHVVAKYRDGRIVILRAAETHHPHNNFLQVWFELGALGAMALLVWGWLAINAIGGLRAQDQPQWQAQFAIIVLSMFSAYGMWQTWFMSAIAASVILLWIATVNRQRLESEKAV